MILIILILLLVIALPTILNLIGLGVLLNFVHKYNFIFKGLYILLILFLTYQIYLLATKKTTFENLKTKLWLIIDSTFKIVIGILGIITLYYLGQFLFL